MASTATSHPLQQRKRHGGWRCGDPTGNRRFVVLFRHRQLNLESGMQLGPITIAFESWGQLNAARDNGVLLLHGFSGDSHAAGPEGPGHAIRGWWDGLIGPGLAIDTDRYFVVCPNVLGGCQGSTGPAGLAPDGKPWGSRFPQLTIRDQVEAEVAFADQMNIHEWHALIGGSMGGMRALEWAIGHADRVKRLLLLATTARSSAENIAFHNCQIQAIRQDPAFLGGDFYDCPSGGPVDGLALAHSIARLTYGCEREINLRISATGSEATEASIATFLAKEGRGIVERLDANSYILLTQAMSGHDIGRGRGGVAAALSRITARVRVVSVSSDRLFPPHRQQELAMAIGKRVTYTSIESHLGHDGYLEEQTQLQPVLRQSLG